MRNLTYSFRFVIVAMFAFILSCKPGEVGPKGDTGAIGAAGAAGTVGAKGDKGDKGDAGTANVIYSDWTSLTFTGSGTNWTAKITTPKITQDILDKGVVLTFFKFGTDVYPGNYVNLPAIAIYQYNSLGSITLKSTFNASYPWRYVIIPGSVPSGRLQSVKAMNYDEIKALYNIPN